MRMIDKIYLGENNGQWTKTKYTLAGFRVPPAQPSQSLSNTSIKCNILLLRHKLPI